MKCTVLMGLLAKNTTITDISLQHQNISGTMRSSRCMMLEAEGTKALGELLKVNTTIRSLNISSFMILLLLKRKKRKNKK